jgi:hypothetical protein
MTFPTWDSEGQKAINSLPTWGKMFAGADNEIAFKLKLASVLASGWALGTYERKHARPKAAYSKVLSVACGHKGGK